MGSIVALYQGQSALLAGIAGLLALATAELFAAVTVTAAVTKVGSRVRLTFLPRRVRIARDRYAPRPLDVFLTAAVLIVGFNLLRSRTEMALTVGVLCLGAFGVAAVLFRATADQSGTDDRGTDGDDGDDGRGGAGDDGDESAATDAD